MEHDVPRTAVPPRRRSPPSGPIVGYQSAEKSARARRPLPRRLVVAAALAFRPCPRNAADPKIAENPTEQAHAEIAGVRVQTDDWRLAGSGIYRVRDAWLGLDIREMLPRNRAWLRLRTPSSTTSITSRTARLLFRSPSAPPPRSPSTNRPQPSDP